MDGLCEPETLSVSDERSRSSGIFYALQRIRALLWPDWIAFNCINSSRNTLDGCEGLYCIDSQNDYDANN